MISLSLTIIKEESDKMNNSFYDNHLNDLKKFSYSLARDFTEADDLVQETCIRAMSNMHKLENLPDYKQRSWLFKVLKNVLIDKRRKEKFEVHLSDENEFMSSSDITSNVEIMDLMNYLSPALQDIVFKKYWMGMTSFEIADILSIPASTVRYRLHTAMKILRSKIKK